MNLLKADFYHLFKDKVFYVLAAFTFIIPLATSLMFSDMTCETVIFQGLDSTILCSLVGIMIALFVGKDYTNNTIRNKICYGEKRYKIMAMTFIESALICLIFIAMSLVSSLIFGGTIGEFTFSSDFAAKFFCQIAILLAFSLVVVAITVCTKSMKIGLVVTLLVAVLLSAVSQMLPMLAVTNDIAAVLCRVVYSTVSGNLINSTGGTYIYTSYSADGAASVTFDHMYLNAIVLAIVYVVIAVGVTALVVRKQSYK